MAVKIGDKFTRKNFTGTTVYEVYDITGNVKAVPGDTPLLHLKVVSRGGWFNAEPFALTVPERSLKEIFD